MRRKNASIEILLPVTKNFLKRLKYCPNFKYRFTKIFYMPTVKFTKALKKFFPDLQDTDAKAASLEEVLHEMDLHYPGLKSYLLDEHGNLRKHVNIFIDGNMIANRNKLNDQFTANSEIYIIQALSGG